MIDQLLEFDTSLFLFLNGLGTPFFDPFWMLITNKITNLSIYLVLLIWYFKLKNGKAAFLILFFIGLLILVTDQTTNLFKYGFERLRPCHNEEIVDIMRIVKNGCGGLYGYFSGHASNSFALSIYFSLLFANRYPKLKYALFFMASLISYSRIYIGVHYPLDIISGALFGTIWSLSFFYISLKICNQFFPKVSLEL
jgi:undecaprenyl-diphosphatase